MRKFLLLLATLAALTIKAPAQFSNPVEDFYHTSLSVPQQYVEPAARRKLDYFLVDSAELKIMTQRCLKAGMVMYGYSSFWETAGTPQKINAIMYGGDIGAACVIYYIEDQIKNLDTWGIRSERLRDIGYLCYRQRGLLRQGRSFL